LSRCLESPEPTYLVHDAFRIEFALKAFQSAIDRLPFANDDFWHLVWVQVEIASEVVERGQRLGADTTLVNVVFAAFSTK